MRTCVLYTNTRLGALSHTHTHTETRLDKHSDTAANSHIHTSTSIWLCWSFFPLYWAAASRSHSLSFIRNRFRYLSNLHKFWQDAFVIANTRRSWNARPSLETVADATPSPPHWHLPRQCVRACVRVRVWCMNVHVYLSLCAVCERVSEWMRACRYYMRACVCVSVFSINN